MASAATRALPHPRMTGDAWFRALEQAAIDWLCGTNPGATSTTIEPPRGGVSARDIALRHADEYVGFNNGSIVYHDDLRDYPTNEPIMNGAASMVYLRSLLGRRTR